MGYIVTEDGLRLYYEEEGPGDTGIISAQVGFYPNGSQQAMAGKGYHVY